MKSLNDQPLPQLASYEECTGCFACAAVCPKSAIETFINDEGHYAIKVNLEKCIHCGKCERVCKAARTEYGCNNLSLSNIYAGYSTDEKLRKNATSGGVFAALAKTVIENGGVVAGAAFDGTFARHILIDKVEDIEKIQGSKYTPSSMKGIYKEIERVLSKKKVLFSGTGCQVAGVLAYFEKNEFICNLLTVDLVCGGVPSTELVKRFNEHNNCKIRSFRNKEKYELIVEDRDGECRKVPRKNLPLDGFVYGLTNRISCYDCKFAFCHRRSDITIGDLWDYSTLPSEHEKGISMLLVHTSRGRDIILDNSNLQIQEISWGVIKKNYRIIYGKEQVYPLRKKLARNLEKMNYSTLMKTYAFDFQPMDIGCSFFKLFRFLLYKHDEKTRNEFIDKTIDENKN